MNKEMRRNRILSVLKTHVYNTSELHRHLAQDFEVDRKTIERDLLKLCAERRIDVVTDGQPREYAINKDYKNNYQLNFSDLDLQILLLSLESFAQEAPASIKEIVIKIENTLSEALPGDLAQALHRFKEYNFSCYTVAGASNATNKKDILEALKAVRERKILHCTYNDKERTLSPILIKVVSGELYLYAKDLGDNALKWFLVGKISKAKISEHLAEIQDDAGLKIKKSFTHFGGFEGKNLIQYKLTGSAALAAFFKKRKLANDQKVKEIDRNSYTITFSQTDSYELFRLIASFGGHLHSIAPEQVCDEVTKIWKNGLKQIKP